MNSHLKVLALTLALTSLVVAKNDPPLGCVHVENAAYHRFMIPSNGTWPGYITRDRLVQYGLTNNGAQNWMLEKIGKEFRFRTQWSQLNPAFLYVGEDFQLYGDRRNVYVTPLMRPDKEVLWKLKKEKSGQFTIQNVNSKEYMFAGEPQYGGCHQLGYQQVSGQVFARKGKKPKTWSPEFLWTIRTC